jgi:hypothetical protein
MFCVARWLSCCGPVNPRSMSVTLLGVVGRRGELLAVTMAGRKQGRSCDERCDGAAGGEG